MIIYINNNINIFMYSHWKQSIYRVFAAKFMTHSETVWFLTASFSSQSAHARPESPCVLAVTVMWHTLCHSYPDTLIGWIITTNGNKLLSQNIYNFGLPSCNKKGCKKSAIHDISCLCVPVWSLSLLLPQVTQDNILTVKTWIRSEERMVRETKQFNITQPQHKKT